MASRIRKHVTPRRVSLLLGTLAACTLNVAPDLEGTAHKLISQQRWGTCPGAEGWRHEMNPIRPADGFVSVGFEKLFVRGADPFPCHHSFDHRYAAHLKFDIPEDAAPITRAILHPIQSVKKRRRGVYGQTTQDECILTVARGTADPTAGFTSGQLPATSVLFPDSNQNGTMRIRELAPEAGPGEGLDVTAVAQDWQADPDSNHGFVILPTQRFNKDQSSLCLHDVKFEVEVEFADD